MNVILPPDLEAALRAQQADQGGRSEFAQNVMLPQMYETLQQDPFSNVTQDVTGGEAARNKAGKPCTADTLPG